MDSLVALLVPSSVWGVFGRMFGTFFTMCLITGADAGNMNTNDFSWQFRMAAALRTPLLVFVVVPLSGVWNAYRKIRVSLRGAQLDTEPNQHSERVEYVKDQVTKWDKEGRKGRLRTARPNWRAMSTKLGSNKKGAHLVDVSQLNHIVSVDLEAMTITAEPAVNMGEITHLLVPKGLALLCQVEMESLTIGGLSMGLGMETNSHVCGFFQETVVAYEIVTATSPPEVRTITKESDPDTFYALPWSVGTLGFLASVTVKIVKTKPFVKMTYTMTRSAEELTRVMTEWSEADEKAPTFLEATVYSAKTAVVQCGEFVDAPETAEEEGMVNGINWWFKKFYFRHLWDLLDETKADGTPKYETYTEIIPLMHYYHRFTRSIFWEIECMIPFANHPLYRLFWGWLGAPEVSLLKLFQGPVIRKDSVYGHVVQESCMPVRRLTEGIKNFEEWWDIYPLLLFPLRVYDRGHHSGFLHPRGPDVLAPASLNAPDSKGPKWGIWVDLAAYGVPKDVREGKSWDAKKVYRAFDKWTRDVGGFCPFYTDLFCTRKEYRQMFDHTLWETCRERLGADDAFPEPFDKIRPEPGIVDLVAEEALEAKEDSTKSE